MFKSALYTSHKEGEIKKAKEIAKKAIKKGLDNTIISELTDLTPDEIEALKQEMKNL